jgi:glutaredoxin
MTQCAFALTEIFGEEDAVMKVELLVVPDCPHAADTETLLATALHDVGLSDVAIATVIVTTAEQAGQLGFIGSPTVLIDGHDPFPHAGKPASLACRIYQNPNGTSGIPDQRELRRALKQAAQHNLETTGSP